MTKPCSISECQRPMRRWHLCDMHSTRLKKHGNTERGFASPEERFWKSITQDGPIPTFRPDLGQCWVWLGTKKGYASLLVDGRPVKVYRFSYELHYGPIETGLVIDHLCRVPQCVRPTHLEPVTRQENALRGIKGMLTTHCPKGHAYDELNTGKPKARPNGRYCRACRRVSAA